MARKTTRIWLGLYRLEDSYAISVFKLLAKGLSGLPVYFTETMSSEVSNGKQRCQ